ncbi:hypothetical protein ZWY2020_059790 [Hordeum vulgare]|nr:hypothetical protein ZWY2020_059790 [Hordeum vulgare]
MMVRHSRNQGVPMKERLDAELKLVGEYGLRCKRELWRSSQDKLDYVLALTAEELPCKGAFRLLSSRLAWQESIHHARVLIRQRHIRQGKLKEEPEEGKWWWRRWW